MPGYSVLKATQGEMSSHENNNLTLADGADRLGSADEEIPLNESTLDVTEELLSCVGGGDVTRLRKLLRWASPSDLNHVYESPTQTSLLHIAVQHNAAEAVRLLLDAGANPQMKDASAKCALHYAATNGNHEVLRALVYGGAEINAKEGQFGRSALHLLATRGSDNDTDFKDCLDLLLKHGVQIDTYDCKGVTPLIMATKKKWTYMTKVLILHGADVDTVVNGQITSSLITSTFPGLLESIDFSQVNKLKTDFGQKLFAALRTKDLLQFKSIIAEVRKTEIANVQFILDQDFGDYTLLRFACDNGLTEFVEVLLKEGADPALANESTLMSPLLYAARSGYHKILKQIVGALLQHKKMSYLRARDRKSETALHKVAKKEFSVDRPEVDYLESIRVLLQQKKHVDVDAQDDFLNTPLHYAVLCDDQQMVRELLRHDAHLGIKNKFGTLAIKRIQPSILEEVLDKCITHNKAITETEFEIILNYSILAPIHNLKNPETECLKFISKSKAHRHLLKHPIIDTFLFFKWQKISPYVYFNISVYALFILLITFYIFFFNGSYHSGNLSNNNITTVTSSNYVLSYSGDLAVKIVLQVIITFLGIYMSIRELFHVYVGFVAYFTKFHNWLEVSILVMVFVYLYGSFGFTVEQNLAAWMVLLCWLKFFLTLGKHPRFAVYVTMFTTVSVNFLKFILMFSVVIAAFSFSFYLLFQLNENFTTYYKSVLKIMTMSTGEMEYTELPLSDFPLSSHLLYVIFVFLIVLVLMNLLNGLAVSDIQNIQQEAELLSYCTRVDLISKIESAFLDGPFSNKPTCTNVSPEPSGLKQDTHSPLTKLMLFLGKRTLMFSSCLKDKEIVLKPNKTSREERWKICSCHSFTLEESHIEAMKSIISARQYRINEDRIERLESRLDSIASSIKVLTNVIKSQGPSTLQN